MAKAPGAQRIEMPPSTVTGDLYGWLVRAALAINNLPVVSYSSTSNPNNSIQTGGLGDRLVNLASGVSVYWVKQTSSLTTGWVAVA